MGIGPNPQSPIPNPQSPEIFLKKFWDLNILTLNNKLKISKK